MDLTAEANPLSDSTIIILAKIQLALRGAVDNAGISYTMSTYLRDVNPLSDSPIVALTIIQRWASELADNISGGGGTGNVRSGTVALAQNDTEKAVVFGTAFTGAGVPSLVPTVIPPIGGDAIVAWVEDGDITNAGATITFSAAIPASGYYLAFVANKE